MEALDLAAEHAARHERRSAEGRLDGEPKSGRVPLPLPPTPLLGREQELAEARPRLVQDDVRLLTMTGPPGVGKTRLALEVASSLQAAFDHGADFVDLATVSDPALVVPAIASVLGVPDPARGTLMDALIEHLESKRLLLLIDNFEQVVDAGASIADLLAAASGLKVLVTSREALRLRWEEQFPVRPLGLPPADVRDLDRLAGYPAVALFVQRAQAIDPTFTPTLANGRAIADICVRLDGLPLAIELAAARTALLPPETIRERLDHRLAVLTRSARDLPERHRTLRAAIGWSYGLLDDYEQALFRRLAVFVGGAGVEAVEAVCADLQIDVAERLASLVDKHLLQRDAPRDSEVWAGVRVRLLETIREFGFEALGAAGERDRTQARHARHFLAIAEEAAPQLRGPEQQRWLDRLGLEHDNLLAALRWTMEQGEAEALCRLVAALSRFWLIRGPLIEGRRWVDEAVQRSPGVPDALRAKVLNAAGNAARRQGDLDDAERHYAEALELARRRGDKPGSSAPLHNLAIVAHHRGDYRVARNAYEESLAVERELGNEHGIATSLNNLANVASEQGDYARARALQEEALALRRGLNDLYGVASSLLNLGNIALGQGDVERAARLYTESRRRFQDLQFALGLAMSLYGLAQVELRRGDVAAAADFVRESLLALRDTADELEVAPCLEVSSLVAIAGEAAGTAATLLGAAAALRESLKTPLPPALRARHARATSATRDRLGEAAFEEMWAAGRAMRVSEALEYALSAPLSGHAPARHAPPALTRREREVVILMARGLSNRDIARRLFITENTAATHVKHILDKLDLTSRAQVAAWAAGTGDPRMGRENNGLGSDNGHS